MLHKFEKHAALAESMYANHAQGLANHGFLFSLLTTDLESGKFMDETMRLFDMYKEKHISKIEREGREVTIKVRRLSG
jgi:hypothetical protein